MVFLAAPPSPSVPSAPTLLPFHTWTRSRSTVFYLDHVDKLDHVDHVDHLDNLDYDHPDHLDHLDHVDHL